MGHTLLLRLSLVLSLVALLFPLTRPSLLLKGGKSTYQNENLLFSLFFLPPLLLPTNNVNVVSTTFYSKILNSLHYCWRFPSITGLYTIDVYNTWCIIYDNEELKLFFTRIYSFLVTHIITHYICTYLHICVY